MQNELPGGNDGLKQLVMRLDHRALLTSNLWLTHASLVEGQNGNILGVSIALLVNFPII